MNIFVPFAKVQPWTMAALLWYLHHTTFVDVSSDEWDYVRYFEQRWAERKTFITVEHDVVPAPGVLESMTACGEGWCVEDYQGPPPASPSVANCFGVVKFSSEFIDTVPNIWADYRAAWRTESAGHAAWQFLDVYLFEYMKTKQHSFTPHHHWPLAVNGHSDDAVYPKVRVTNPDGVLLRDHELTANPITLSLTTL
jgi:hypothetical protein